MTVESIAKTLGTGSGIDIGALVTGLVDASFGDKNAALERKSEALTAQISGVARLKNAITGFSTALTSIARSGQLSTQPTSSNPSILGVSALSGATISTVNATIEVRQLAQSQVAHSALVADRTAPVGQGTLTLSFGTHREVDGEMAFVTGGTPIAIDIDASNSSLDGIASAINAKGAGITASVLSDVNGARLVLKGPTGESQAFEISVAEAAGNPGLARFAIGAQAGPDAMTVGTPARDAIVAVDGIAIQRASNTITNLIPGLRLELQSAGVGTMVRIGTTPPTQALRTVVEDFVATYNDLILMLAEETAPQSGALARDPAATAMMRTLGGLTLATLQTGQPGGPATLASIGVATNRDGSLRVDTFALDKALAENPRAVEAMFAPTGGLPAKLEAVQKQVTDKVAGLGASEARYTRQQVQLSDDQAKVLEQAEAMRTRMTQQFASMDAKVAAYRSTQSFLEQQVEAWNAQRR